MRQEKTFSKGLKDGIPICLGYLSVSFTFGMMAAKGGLPLWAIQLISMTNLTSAGQFTGTTLILSGGAYLEIAVTTFVINLRYTLMGVLCRRSWSRLCRVGSGLCWPLATPTKFLRWPCSRRDWSAADICWD